MGRSGATGLRRREFVAAGAALLAGCGGVDTGGTGEQPGLLAVGPISGFGSIIVNGIRFDDRDARIEDEDGAVRERAGLALGMQTKVLAAAPSAGAAGPRAVARLIRVRVEIAGPLEAVDPAARRLRLLGQTVELNAGTALAVPLQSLAAGREVEVHGRFDAARGHYVASRVEPRAASGDYVLRGVVGALDLGARTLDIGAARIDWSAVAPADPAAALAPGRRLRLKLARAPAGGLWIATALRASEAPLPDSERAELEGRISAFVSAARFEVDGVPVDASGAAFPDGSAALAVGLEVRLRGRLAGGTLLAAEVAIEAEDEGEGDGPIELEGEIGGADPSARRFVLRGTTVAWSDATRFESSSAADLVDGRRAKVRGRLAADGTRVEASVIHVED